MNYMRATGISYPKACEECGLGPMQVSAACESGGKVPILHGG